MEYLGKVYAKIGGRYVPLEATAEEIDKWKKAYESQPKQLSNEVKAKIIKVRDALIRKDYDEAYHVLYSIACPDFDSINPWEDFESAVPTNEGFFH